MQVIFYKTYDDRRKVNKTLTGAIPLDVILKDDTSIKNPTIIVNNANSIKDSNYMYIPDFGRYYYVGNPVSMTGARVAFECHSDVLMSRKMDILNLEGIMERSATNVNNYLTDNIPLLGYRSQKIINFPAGNSFNTGLQYILTVAGGDGN